MMKKEQNKERNDHLDRGQEELEREDDREECDLEDAPPRTRRRRPVNQSTQAGQEAGWSRFDLGKSAQLLNSLNPGTVNRELTEPWNSESRTTEAASKMVSCTGQTDA